MANIRQCIHQAFNLEHLKAPLTTHIRATPDRTGGVWRGTRGRHRCSARERAGNCVVAVEVGGEEEWKLPSHSTPLQAVRWQRLSARRTWEGSPARAAGQAAREYVLAGKWLRASPVQQTDSIWRGGRRRRRRRKRRRQQQQHSFHPSTSHVTWCKQLGWTWGRPGRHGRRGGGEWRNCSYGMTDLPSCRPNCAIDSKYSWMVFLECCSGYFC